MSQRDRERLKELDKLIFEQGMTAERSGNTYAAHMQLFNVAVGAKDTEAQEKHRLTMHTMLDIILDSGITVATMNEERQEIALRLMHGH